MVCLTEVVLAVCRALDNAQAVREGALDRVESVRAFNKRTACREIYGLMGLLLCVCCNVRLVQCVCKSCRLCGNQSCEEMISSTLTEKCPLQRCLCSNCLHALRRASSIMHVATVTVKLYLSGQLLSNVAEPSDACACALALMGQGPLACSLDSCATAQVVMLGVLFGNLPCQPG